MRFQTYDQISSFFDLDYEPGIDEGATRFAGYQRLLQELLNCSARLNLADVTAAITFYLDIISNIGENDLTNQPFPALTIANAENLMAWLQERPPSCESVSSVVAAVAYNLKAIFAAYLARGSMPISILVEITSYTSWSQDRTRLDQLRDRINLQLAPALGRIEEEANQHSRSRQQAEALVNAIAQRQQELDSQLNEYPTKLSSFEQEFSKIEKVSGAKFTETDKGLEKLAKRMDQINSQADFLSAQKLWRKRATANSRAFWLSSVVIVVLLAAVPGMLIWRLDQTLDILQRIGKATAYVVPGETGESAAALTLTTLSRLLLISLPIIFYLWMVRLIVRFNVRSLVLHDDAESRDTMMDTYLELVGKEGASKEDRGLVLQALFRPSPGQNSDSPDLPNIAELIDKIAGKIKS